MNCTDIATELPLYLSGELHPGRAAEFSAHLKFCPVCAREVDRQTQADAALREAMLADEVDTSALDRRVRARIAGKPVHIRWLVATAAAIAIALLFTGLGVRWLMGPKAGLYADAAQDHHREVVEQSPRRWVSDRAGIEALAGRVGLSATILNAVAPREYRLERGKLCRLDGRVFLHLVYSDGSRETSVFLHAHDPGSIPGRPRETANGHPLYASQIRGEALAAVQTPQLTAVFVTAGHSGDVLNLARSAANTL